MPKINEKFMAQPYIGNTADMAAFLYPTATTAELDDITDDINTQYKYVGKSVFDTTLGQPVWADAATAGGTWSLATGVVSSTPV